MPQLIDDQHSVAEHCSLSNLKNEVNSLADDHSAESSSLMTAQKLAMVSATSVMSITFGKE